METEIFDLNAKPDGKISLPEWFGLSPNMDLVERAFLAERSFLFQPQGRFKLAGMQTTAEYIGRKGAYRALKNRGQAKLPREKLGGGVMGNVKGIPSAVKGRRAHPPTPEEKIIENMNRKEYKRALQHAIALSLNAASPVKLPVVLDSKAEQVSKTKDLRNLLTSIGLGGFLDTEKRLKEKRRSARMVRYKKNILIVAKSSDSPIVKAARNIKGVNAIGVNDLRVMFIAPNCKPKIVVWTKDAISMLNDAIDKIKLEDVKKLKEIKKIKI